MISKWDANQLRMRGDQEEKDWQSSYGQQGEKVGSYRLHDHQQCIVSPIAHDFHHLHSLFSTRGRNDLSFVQM